MVNAQLAEIEKDLRAFADPWSDIAIDKGSAVWERDGETISVEFAAPAGGGSYPDIIHNGTRSTYKQFLAGPAMASLASLADSIVKMHAPKHQYVDTWASLADDGLPDRERHPAVELIRTQSTENLPYMSTRVVLVRGEAGSGKTVSLREATARQASLFRLGKATSLFFLVDAQGRALSRLEDAMAKDLQDVRARFSYAAVAPLTRHNLLIPIIDGFDELLGSGGYDEAFSSLAAFLATLGGEGSVVASARSAFFDYRNFYDNATRFSAEGNLNYEVETLQVIPWDAEQVRRYFDAYVSEKNNAPEIRDTLVELLDSLTPTNEGLLSKPFYAARVAEIVAAGGDIRGDEDLLEQLVNSFIEREHLKLLDRDGKPLLSKKGHRAFVASLAEEMWWQENRRLDVGTVQAVAELITEQFGLPPTAAHAIVERVSSYAFLSSDSSARKSLRFEHEVFYGYFLAHRLRDFIEHEPNDLRRFIARAVAEPTLVDQTVRLIGSDVERCTRAIEAISSVLRPNISELVAKENAGVLIGALLRTAGTARVGLRVRHAIFQQMPLGPFKGKEIGFERCDFVDVDFSHVVIERPDFEGSTLRNLTVDLASTRLVGLSDTVLDQVHGLIVRGEETALPVGRVFSPDEIAAVLVHLGMPVPPQSTHATARDPVVLKKITVLERFVHKMERRFYASHEDIERFPFANTPEWEAVKRLLERHSLLQEHFVAKSGPNAPLVRLAYPPEIIRRGEDPRDGSVPDAVREFWRELAMS